MENKSNKKYQDRLSGKAEIFRKMLAFIGNGDDSIAIQVLDRTQNINNILIIVTITVTLINVYHILKSEIYCKFMLRYRSKYTTIVQKIKYNRSKHITHVLMF